MINSFRDLRLTILLVGLLGIEIINTGYSQCKFNSNIEIVQNGLFKTYSSQNIDIRVSCLSNAMINEKLNDKIIEKNKVLYFLIELDVNKLTYSNSLLISEIRRKINDLDTKTFALQISDSVYTPIAISPTAASL